MRRQRAHYREVAVSMRQSVGIQTANEFGNLVVGGTSGHGRAARMTCSVLAAMFMLAACAGWYLLADGLEQYALYATPIVVVIGVAVVWRAAAAGSLTAIGVYEHGVVWHGRTGRTAKSWAAMRNVDSSVRSVDDQYGRHISEYHTYRLEWLDGSDLTITDYPLGNDHIANATDIGHAIEQGLDAYRRGGTPPIQHRHQETAAPAPRATTQSTAHKILNAPGLGSVALGVLVLFAFVCFRGGSILDGLQSQVDKQVRDPALNRRFARVLNTDVAQLRTYQGQPYLPTPCLPVDADGTERSVDGAVYRALSSDTRAGNGDEVQAVVLLERREREAGDYVRNGPLGAGPFTTQYGAYRQVCTVTVIDIARGVRIDAGELVSEAPPPTVKHEYELQTRVKPEAIVSLLTSLPGEGDGDGHR